MPEEKIILTQFQAGDVKAFDRIYHKYRNRLYPFAFGHVKDHDSAADIVQEVFVALWEKREQLKTELNFSNYIFTMTYNSIRKHFRKKTIETRARDYLLYRSSEITENTIDRIIYNELLELAYKAIEKLPPKRKMVYKLIREDGMKVRKIASKLNISCRTVENHLAKAQKSLRAELAVSIRA